MNAWLDLVSSLAGCISSKCYIETVIPVKVNATKDVKSGAMTSALRCFQVLELLAEEPFELSVSDVALKLNSPRASAHRLCATLVEGGLVERLPGSKRYRLTPKSLWVGSGYLRHSAIYRAAFFPMQGLAKEIPGTAQLGYSLKARCCLSIRWAILDLPTRLRTLV